MTSSGMKPATSGEYQNASTNNANACPWGHLWWPIEDIDRSYEGCLKPSRREGWKCVCIYFKFNLYCHGFSDYRQDVWTDNQIYWTIETRFSSAVLNDVAKEDEMGGACSTNGEKRNAYRLLLGKPEGKTPLGGPWHRWVDNINMDLGEKGWGGVDWIGPTQDKDKWRAIMNLVINFRVP
jgi:hypothetical protein